MQSTDGEVAAAEHQRRRPAARVVEAALVAAPVEVDLAGTVVKTWAYGPRPGAPGLRLRAGDVVRATLSNSLPDSTTIHWHGIALRNDMDGVPDLTQKPIPAGGQFVYEFTAPDPGTYFFHPHSGMQLDRGLYSPLIVEDPAEPLSYDSEYVVVLDDWVDGLSGTPDERLAEVRRTMAGMGHGGMGHDGMGHGGMGNGGMSGMSGMSSDALGGDAGDVRYPTHLLNGRPAADRETYAAAAGDRVRLRIVNAGSDTAYRFAVGGHRLTVTHTDGFPVVPVEVDTLIIGMGERYDAVIRPASGVWPVVAVPEGKDGMGAAVLRTTDAATAAAPSPDARPDQLGGRLLEDSDLKADPRVALPPRRPDRAHEVALTIADGEYKWLINGEVHEHGEGRGARFDVEEGQRVRLQYQNRTSMWHPMHLHGHTFERVGGGPRKDTVKVLPGRTVAVVFDADNPGQWMLHCHNLYHQESGMGSVVSYGG